MSEQREKLDKTTRRQFIELVLTSATLATAGVLDPHFETHLAQGVSLSVPAGCTSINIKDKVGTNFSNRTPHIRREYPKVSQYLEKRQDWYGHLSRPLHLIGIPGIDYYASNREPFTEITSTAKGIVYGQDKTPIGGLRVAVYHGLGYITSYMHMVHSFVNPGEEIPRGAIIGSGGGTGRGGAAYPHMHLTTYCPAFTPYLKNIVFEAMHGEKYPWQYPSDGEQFAIDNSGQLPFVNRSDFVFDEVFWKTHLAASEYANTVLKEINMEEARSVLKKSDLEKLRGTDLSVDVRILYLYELLLKGKLPFQFNDNEKIGVKLIEYMSTAPAFTSPIKNEATPELHKIIRTEPTLKWMYLGSY